MDCFVCNKESSQLRTLSETGFQTLKDAVIAGGKILPSDVIFGVLYHNSCRSAYKRSLEKEDGRQEIRASCRNEFHIKLDCFYCKNTILKFTDSDSNLSDREKVGNTNYLILLAIIIIIIYLKSLIPQKVDWVHPREKEVSSLVMSDSEKSFENSLHLKIQR